MTRRRKRGWARRKYRLRVRVEQFVEEISLVKLYERDKKICGLCGRLVAWNKASRGHIIPLAKGGMHSYENTRLEHKRCNNIKGDRLDSEVDWHEFV